MTERDAKGKEKRKFRFAERFGGFPVLLLALAGILLLLSLCSQLFHRPLPRVPSTPSLGLWEVGIPRH